MFAFKGSFGFELIIPIDRLAVIPFSCSEINLRTIWRQQRLCAFKINLIKQLMYFSIGKIRITEASRGKHWFIRLEFNTSSVWQRLSLNLIEFIHSKIWRSFDSLAVKNLNFINNLTTTTSFAGLQNAAAFVLKLFSGKSNFRSRK